MSALLLAAPLLAALAAPPALDLADVDDLPLTVVPSDGPTTSYAIFLTGDGGWAHLASSVADDLAQHGITTIGFSTLRYFWSPKPPLRTAADLNRIFAAIHSAAPAAKIELIGYSYGAAIIPVVYPLLDDAAKGMVSRLALMMPDAKAGIVEDDAPPPAPGAAPVYDFSTTFWADDDPAAGYDIATAIRADKALPVLCVYSSDDDGACPALAAAPPANVTLKVLGEGHHFGGDYDALAALVLAN